MRRNLELLLLMSGLALGGFGGKTIYDFVRTSHKTSQEARRALKIDKELDTHFSAREFVYPETMKHYKSLAAEYDSLIKDKNVFQQIENYKKNENYAGLGIFSVFLSATPLFFIGSQIRDRMKDQ